MNTDISNILEFFSNPNFRRQYLKVAASHSDINMIEMARVDIAAFLSGQISFLDCCAERRSILLNSIVPERKNRQTLKVYSGQQVKTVALAHH